MNEQILQAVNDVWQHHCGALEDAIAETIAGLKNALDLDEYHRHRNDPDQLERDLGPLAATNLDLGSLSRVLSESARSQSMGPDRRKRMQELILTLEEMREACPAAMRAPASVDLEQDENEIRDLAEQHFTRIASIFRTLSIAQLDSRSKYDPETHDAVFADFNWRQLGPGELRMCPPFLVVARVDQGASAPLLKMMSLLESGMPIKIAALRSSLRQDYSAASGVAVPSVLTMETIPLAMRGVYFVQTSVAAADFQKQIFEGLTAPWPSVISVLCPQDEEQEAAFRDRAGRAVRSRAFPTYVYDPDRNHRFGSCFDLSSSPSPNAPWSNETLSGCDPQGQPKEVEEAFTFAHFAAAEAEFAADFTDPPAIAERLISMTDYLELSRRQRADKLPSIRLAGKDGKIVRRVVSPAIALQCSERLHLWRTLQEISGIGDPRIDTTSSAPQSESAAPQVAVSESQRQETEEGAAQRDQMVVASVVRKLVTHLTGIDPFDS